jgi:thioredoxin
MENSIIEQKEFKTFDDFNLYLKNIPGVIIYVSTPPCNVCKILKPKVISLISETFPKLKFFYLDAEAYPELSGQMSVFTVPTVIFYLDGKEWFRKSRNMSITELQNEIERPYSLFF